MDAKRLQEIRERHAAITDGVWEWRADSLVGGDGHETILHAGYGVTFGDLQIFIVANDADFIAAAPDDVRDLLADNDALRAENEALREQLARMRAARLVVNDGWRDGD